MSRRSFIFIRIFLLDYLLTADLEGALREEFEVPSSTVCRVWQRDIKHVYKLLSQHDLIVEEAGLDAIQQVVIICMQLYNKQGRLYTGLPLI